MWKADGPEQKLLDRLFIEKKVNGSMKPSMIQDKYDIFKPFSAAVFRNHWGKTRRMFENDFDKRENMDIDDILNSSIPELDGSQANTSFTLARHNKTDVENVNTITTKIEFTQPPVIPTVFNNPDTKQDVVIVITLLFPGVKQLYFDVVDCDSGQKLIVKYGWPAFMYNPQTMLQEAGKPHLPNFHPKVQAVEKALQNYRAHIEDTPFGEINISLPRHVNTDPESWKKTYSKQDDGGTVVVFEFPCVQKEYTIRKLYKALNID